MLNSRKIEDLQPEARVLCQTMLDICAKEGIRIIPTSTERDYEEQTHLYAQGRTVPGKIVTNAKAGESFHNFKCAWDAVPLDAHGQCIWDEKHPVFQQMLKIARAAGAECGADWVTFKDYDHFQYNPVKLSTSQAKMQFESQGKILPESV